MNIWVRYNPCVFVLFCARLGQERGWHWADLSVFIPGSANVRGDSFRRHHPVKISAGRQIRILYSCAHLHSPFHCNHY